MSKKVKGAYAAPTTLRPVSKDDDTVLRVIIETPKGSRNKYKFDPDLRMFSLNKVLPDGMVFPFDFGFVPSTEAEDGDPLDVLLLMDEPAFPGCMIECRVLGIIEGMQTEKDKNNKNKETRNDRLVAVACDSHTHSDLKDISDLNKTLVDEVSRFFVNYHQERGRKFRVLGVRGRNRAWNMIQKTIKENKAA